MPFDFTRYLASQLGITEEEGNSLLGSWLKEYEPLCCKADERPSAEFPSAAEPLQQVG